MTHVVFEREPGAPPDGPNLAMPKPVGRAMVALALITLAVAAYSSVTGARALVAPATPAVAERDLVLRDRASGGIDVLDARTGDVLQVIASADSARFLRTVVRGLGKHVDRREASLQVVFTLAMHEDGELTISRRGSDRINALNGFGASQVNALTELLRKR